MPPPVTPVERKRIVVVGSAGRLGSALVENLGSDHTVIGLTRSQMDLASERSIADALEPLDYDLLILPAALTAVDYCETHKEEAFAVNAEAPRTIAMISAAKGAHVTYVSTDFVFDGNKQAPYLETDMPDPVSVYGASKLNGEENVLAVSAGNLVVRVSWLFGPGKPAFPEWIVDKACNESELTLPGDKIGSPTYSSDLVGYMNALLFGISSVSASGVFHLCNSQPCTWREWGQFCIDTARDAGLPVKAGRIEGVPVDSVPAFVAKRPVNSAMSTEKFSNATGIRPRDWMAAVREHLLHSDCFKKYSQPKNAG
ncbi:MAG: dTDP-4-dehydrorhamnose reductase [Luteolibacter sp.]